MPTLLVHPDVHTYLTKLDVSIRDFVRQKVLWTQTQLAMTGRASRVKGTRTQAWRRTPVRGNQYYLWWAPAEEVGAGSPEFGPTIAVRDLRHHDNLTPPPPTPRTEYNVVDPRTIDPRTTLQTSVAKGPPSSGISATIVRGQPGTGKTLSLLYAARDLAASHRILYITYTPQLVEDARLFAKLAGIGDQVVVMTLAALEAAILRQPQDAATETPRALGQRFDTFVRGLDSTVVGPWSNKGRALWAETRASLVGMALPFPWRRGPVTIPPGELLDLEIYHDMSGLDKLAAESAHHIADLARRRDVLSDQTRARAALDALIDGQTGNLAIDGVNAVLLDEAQDLTPIELALLLEIPRILSKRNHSALFIAAGDESQTVHPSGFAWGIAKDLIRERLGREPKDITLATMMRSPSAILSIVKKTGGLYKTLPKTFRPGGAVPDDGPTIDDAGHLLQCVIPQHGDNAALLETLGLSPGRALITLDNKVPMNKGSSAKNTALIFTPAEIKGLERRIVVVTGLDETLSTLHRLTNRHGYENRSLESLEARYLIDGVRVALSRATDTLILLRKDSDLESLSQTPVDLTAGIALISWDDLLQRLRQVDLSEEERVEGFLAEAHEHARRDDTTRALECLDRADALGKDLSDITLLASIRELRERLEKNAGLGIVVAETGGDYTSLQEAINKAPEGSTIRVRPGTYRGPFLIKKDLKIIGDGPREAIVLEGDSAVILLHSKNVTLEGLSIWRHQIETFIPPKASAGMLKQIAQMMTSALRIKAAESADDIVRKSGRSGIAVAVENAKLHMRACDVRSEGNTGIFGTLSHIHIEGCIVHSTTTAFVVGHRCAMTIEQTEVKECTDGITANTGMRLVVRNSLISQIEGVGISLGPEIAARIENNDIREVKRFGICLGSSVSMIQGNRIHKCHGGIQLQNHAGATIEENDVTECSFVGLEVGTDAHPVVRNNRFRNGDKYGIFIHPKGGGTFENNQVVGNTGIGVVMTERGVFVMRNTLLQSNAKVDTGVYVGPGTTGVFEDNDICNTQGVVAALHLVAGLDFVVRKNRIHHNLAQGIVCNGVDCVIEDNEIFENGDAGLAVGKDGHPIGRNNRIHHNNVGIHLYDGAGGLYEKNDLHTHKIVGILVSDSNGTFRKNRIRRGSRYAVSIKGASEPLFEQNEISESGLSKNGANVSVSNGANPVLRDNTIQGGVLGLVFHHQAQGVAEGNEINSTAQIGVFVQQDSKPILRRNRIHDAKDHGIVIQHAGGTFEDNEVYRSRGIGIRIDSMDVVVRGNRIHDNSAGGLAVNPHSKGIFERNRIINNKKWGFMIAQDSNPMVRHNVVQGSPLGIVVCKNAYGTIIENDARGNERGLLVDPGSMPVQCEGNISEGNPVVGAVGQHPSTKGVHRGSKDKKGRGK